MRKKKNLENICALCRYCTFEEEHNTYVCHNENSEKYGKLLLTKDVKNNKCKDFSKHTYSEMSLKEALRIHTNPDHLVNVSYSHKLPDKEQKCSYVVLAFKNNDALETWRDAHVRLFTEFMEMAKRDGDFEDD